MTFFPFHPTDDFRLHASNYLSSCAPTAHSLFAVTKWLSPRFRFKSLIFLRRFSRHFCYGDVAQLPHTRIRKKNLLYDYNSSHFSPSSSSTLYGSRNVTLSRRKERRRCAYKFRGLSCLRKKSACYY